MFLSAKCIFVIVDDELYEKKASDSHVKALSASRADKG